METNWVIVGSVLLGAVALIAFLFKRNLKDEEDLIEYLDKEETEEKNGA